MKKIANVKEKIQEEDANDVTPRPKFPREKVPLRRTSSHLLIPLIWSDSPDGPLTDDIGNTSDEYKPKEPVDGDGPETEPDEPEGPPLKKKGRDVKDPKPKVREMINAAHKEAGAIKGGAVLNERQSIRVDDHEKSKSGLGHGKKLMHEATRFVISP